MLPRNALGQFPAESLYSLPMNYWSVSVEHPHKFNTAKNSRYFYLEIFHFDRLLFPFFKFQSMFFLTAAYIIILKRIN